MDHRWRLEVGVGWDNSLAGNINSGAIGTLNDQVVVVLPNSVLRRVRDRVPPALRRRLPDRRSHGSARRVHLPGPGRRPHADGRFRHLQPLRAVRPVPDVRSRRGLQALLRRRPTVRPYLDGDLRARLHLRDRCRAVGAGRQLHRARHGLLPATAGPSPSGATPACSGSCRTASEPTASSGCDGRRACPRSTISRAPASRRSTTTARGGRCRSCSACGCGSNQRRRGASQGGTSRRRGQIDAHRRAPRSRRINRDTVAFGACPPAALAWYHRIRS